jgi:hypothetical protein
LLLKGNTMNFYTVAPRWLLPVLTDLGFACLAFNRGGHDILSIRDSRAPEDALQLTCEGIGDSDYSARWLACRGARYATSHVKLEEALERIGRFVERTPRPDRW